MPFKKVYLDSNVFIKAFEGSESDDLAFGLTGIFALAASRVAPPFATSQITLAELLVHPFRNGNTESQRRYISLLSASSAWLEVRVVNSKVLVLAARLRGQSSLKLPDAIHAATAMLAGCSHFFSGDADFKSIRAADRLDQLQPLSLAVQSVTELADWLRE